MGRQGRIHRSELVGLMRESLGDDKASQLVVSTAAELGMSTFDFSAEEATRVLEAIARTPGLVGITAMLAKSRLTRLVREMASAPDVAPGDPKGDGSS